MHQSVWRFQASVLWRDLPFLKLNHFGWPSSLALAVTIARAQHNSSLFLIVTTVCLRRLNVSGWLCPGFIFRLPLPRGAARTWVNESWNESFVVECRLHDHYLVTTPPRSSVDSHRRGLVDYWPNWNTNSLVQESVRFKLNFVSLNKWHRWGLGSNVGAE